MDNIQVSENIREDLKAFTNALKNSKEYLEYRESAEEVEKNPELQKRLSDYRLMNYNLQQEPDGALVDQRTEELEGMFEELERDPVAARFLDAEMTFCRMMQEITLSIYASLDIE